VATRQEGFSNFYNLGPFDNVDQGLRLEGVLVEGLGAFDVSSRGCHAAFPFARDVFQFAFHGHVYWSSCTVASNLDDQLHPVDWFMTRISLCHKRNEW
jgi:hypothetical protein